MPQGTLPYWMNVPPIYGERSRPQSSGIAVIGSGLSGASVAYWLLEQGWGDVTIIDHQPEQAATWRNCGHILYGTVESMRALVALHGREVAREIWDFSIGVCHEVRETVRRLGIDCDYRQDGYLVIALDETEDREVQESVALLNGMGFQSDYLAPDAVRALGFRNVQGARYEAGSAQAHPVKFRNALLRDVLARGVRYHTGWPVKAVTESGHGVTLDFGEEGQVDFDFAVIAANAYAPLLSDFFASRRLVEPFRGQIITSRPLRHDFKVRYPHSFDHGYEYALVTPDQRLMIGGWRHHTPEGEVGTYELAVNPLVERGLEAFVREHYDIAEPIAWEYSWSGIMAASKTAFPFIGPTTSPRIFACAGYTGHGFSWAHGSAKLLSEIMAGRPIPPVARHFNPARL